MKSEIAERAAREIFEAEVEALAFDRPGPSVKRIAKLVERAIAESQPRPSLDSLVGLLTQLRTYYIQRDDPKVANWCMRVITEAKELQL